MEGQVKWFDDARGFGFIAQQGGPDVFVHFKSIQGKGFKTLNDGDVVEFDLIEKPKGPSADNVRILKKAVN